MHPLMRHKDPSMIKLYTTVLIVLILFALAATYGDCLLNNICPEGYHDSTRN